MVASRHLFYKMEYPDEIQRIADELERYRIFFSNVSKSAVGAYFINQILDMVEDSLYFLEIKVPILRNWINKYLEDHRGELWLFYGINQGNTSSDYWEINKTNFEELEKMWPFIFKRDSINYKDFVVDLRGAQSEVLRQRKRQETSNPKYTPFHPDGCPSGCSCWMMDDMEQWWEEEHAEIKTSKNIFFNGNLQKEFYNEALKDLAGLKEQWENWAPFKPSKTLTNTDIKIVEGQTPISLLINWIKDDFIYEPVFSFFYWSDNFKVIWENIDFVENFIHCQRQKLKKILELI